MEAKINLGNYESLTVSLGASHDVPGRFSRAKMKRLHAQLMTDIEVAIDTRLDGIREQWSNRTDVS